MSFGTGSYGTGPYGLGLDFPIVSPNPPGLGYGGIDYGFGPYGGGEISLPNPQVNGGYGGLGYGQGVYGGLGNFTAPGVSGAVSLDGFHIEVFFSEPMMNDASLLDPANYVFSDLFGAAPGVVALLVEPGLTTLYGVSSVVLTHSGTTLGGLYSLSLSGIKNLGGVQIDWGGIVSVQILCQGSPPEFIVNPLGPTQLLLEFDHPILPESGFSPGVQQIGAYGFETEYPVPIQVLSVTHPVALDGSKVLLDVQGMTSTDYELVLSPARAIVYDGSVLPNQTEGFAAHELGIGTSSLASGLVLKPSPLAAYGWDFIDTSGRILPVSSYRVDFSGSVKSGPTPGVFWFALFSDGSIQTEISLEKGVGVYVLRINSGAFSWSQILTFSGDFDIAWVRNQKAGTQTILWNGVPLASFPVASFTGVASLAPGVRFVTNPTGGFTELEVTLEGLRITSSQTVFSEAWNFFHEVLAPFEGLDGQTKDFILTRKGPLVKAWGNATPATRLDVKVRLNGVEVEIADVNPYIGKIYPAIPIPLLPPGELDVSIDYYWMYNPVFAFAGLNTEGLNLNKYDPLPLLPLENDDPGEPFVNFGAPMSGQADRFEYGVVLNSVAQREPYLLSSRFWAFQKQYTAALNSPNTLLLNQDPHIIAKPSKQELTSGVTVFYEGTEDPTLEGWSLVGVNGYLSGGEAGDESAFQNSLPGTYPVLDITSGSFGVGQPAFYSKSEISPFTSSIVMVSRFVVTNDITLTPDGVFSGVGFGLHDDNHLYMVGALTINGLQHVGMLVEPAYPELTSSWSLAFPSTLDILNSTTFSTSQLPKLALERLASNDVVRFQVLEGPQAGVYTLLSASASGDGSYACQVSPSFPANPGLFGNSTATGFFEIRWDGDGDRARPLTYRLVVKSDVLNLPKGYAELYVGGFLSGQALILEGAPSFAIPPEGVLLFPTGVGIEFFWGSLSLPAMNSSDWNFVRYGIQPGESAVNFDGISVTASLLELPEDDPNDIWFVTQDFGNRFIDSQNRLALQKEASTEDLDTTIGYSRIEPFFTNQISCDFDAHFQVDTSSEGAGDAVIEIDDGVRKVVLATLSYREAGGKRSLVSLPKISLLGLKVPTEQDWVLTSGSADVKVEGRRIQISTSASSVTWTRETFPSSPETVGRVLEATFQGETGSVSFGVGSGPSGTQRGVGVRFVGATVELFSLATQLTVATWPFVWMDGNKHTVRVLVDPDNDVVSLVVDDTLLGTAFWTAFAFETDLAARLEVGLGSSIEIFGISVTPFQTPDTLRTLGVFLGPTWEDIDSWKIPRLDSTPKIKNSNLSALVQPMDWTAFTKVRIHRDPAWGVVIQRPDLGPPPFYTAEFATQTLQPTSGWISVEYPRLPLSSGGLGRLSFGALRPESVTQQRWSFVKYRVFLRPGKNRLAPQHNVLNQFHVITSAEPLLDTGIETRTIRSRDSRTIVVSDCGIFADRVFNLSYVNEAGKVVLFEPPSFTFDKDTQVVSIVSTTTLGYRPSQDLNDLEDLGVTNPSLNQQDFPFPNPALVFEPDGIDPNLPSPPLLPEPVQVDVVVSFAAGAPFTEEYICSQPFDASSTLLGEGTPDYTKNLIANSEFVVESNSKLNDVFDVLNAELILNDNLEFVNWTEDLKSQYETVQFCEKSIGQKGYVSPYCDKGGPFSLPGVDGSQPGDIGGGVQIEFSGFAFSETEGLGFFDGPEYGGQALAVLKAADGDLGEAVIFSQPLDGFPPIEEGWGVVVVLYDLVTNQVTYVYMMKGGELS